MNSPTPKSIEETKKATKRAKKLKPPRKKYIHSGWDIYKEFKISHVETNLPREKWIKRQRELIKLCNKFNINR